MRYKTYAFAAMLALLAGCQGNDRQSKEGQPSSSAATEAAATNPPANDTSSAGLIPLEDQYLPNPGQHCYIRRLYTKNDSLFIDADYIQFYVGKAADSVATKRRDGEITVDANGDTTWKTLDDVYILNENKKIRTLSLAKDVKYYSIYVKGDVYRKLSSLDDLKLVIKNEGIFVLTLNEKNEVAVIKQQYLP